MDTLLHKWARRILHTELADARWNYLQTLAKLEIAEHREAYYRTRFTDLADALAKKAADIRQTERLDKTCNY